MAGENMNIKNSNKKSMAIFASIVFLGQGNITAVYIELAKTVLKSVMQINSGPFLFFAIQSKPENVTCVSCW